EAADSILARLGALDKRGSVTLLGKRMLSFPVHPRQARLITEAETRGVGEEGSLLAALVGERDIRLSARGAGLATQQLDKKNDPRATSIGPSDLLIQFDLFKEIERKKFSADTMRRMGLDPGATLAVERVRNQLTQHLKRQQG